MAKKFISVEDHEKKYLKPKTKELPYSSDCVLRLTNLLLKKHEIEDIEDVHCNKYKHFSKTVVKLFENPQDLTTTECDILHDLKKGFAHYSLYVDIFSDAQKIGIDWYDMMREAKEIYNKKIKYSINSNPWDFSEIQKIIEERIDKYRTIINGKLRRTPDWYVMDKNWTPIKIKGETPEKISEKWTTLSNKETVREMEFTENNANKTRYINKDLTLLSYYDQKGEKREISEEFDVLPETTLLKPLYICWKNSEKIILENKKEDNKGLKNTISQFLELFQ